MLKKIFPFILILCMAGAWISIAYRNISLPEAYNHILSAANEAYEQGYYLEAQGRLNQAQTLYEGTSYEMDVLQRNIYHGLQDGSSYERQLQSMIANYPEQEENYVKLIHYYHEIGNKDALCSYLPKYLKQWPENEELKSTSQELDKQYEYITTGYYNVKYASRSLVNIQESQYEIIDDKETIMRKLLNSKGITVFDAGYAQMSVAQDGTSCFVCDQEGSWSRVDISQNLLAQNKDVQFDYVGRLAANNIATAVTGGNYQFINEKMKISDIKWEEAGTFNNDLNAVKKDGRWALVTTESWGEVTEFPYIEIPRNSQDCCTEAGYAVVADEKGYYVICTKGFLPVSENVYEEMKAFECNQPVAYRQGEEWGFVNNQGNIYIEACYEDAKSFENGYAAVKQNGLWGYIDQNGTMVIEPQFQEALNVLGNGYAYVKNEFGYWDYLIISKLYYTDRG